jgi:hypothetical protein
VKNRFQNLPFKFNLQRYTKGQKAPAAAAAAEEKKREEEEDDGDEEEDGGLGGLLGYGSGSD